MVLRIHRGGGLVISGTDTPLDNMAVPLHANLRSMVAVPPPLGTHRVMYTVDDTVARLRRHGGELIGEVAQYGESTRLCYFRGPAGIIIGLAEYK